MINLFKRLFLCLKSLKTIFKYGGYTVSNITETIYGPNYLSDKTVLITGGSRGIGKSICEKFLKCGSKVIITGRDVKSLKMIQDEMNNPNLYIIEWDISNLSCIDNILDEITNKFGEINVLINNAGIYTDHHFPNCTIDDWDKVYDVNHKGTFFLTQSVCKRWIKSYNPDQKPRKIIIISSQGGFVGANNAYRMTKWDMRGFTQYLGASMSKYSIITNGIAPGIILTDMQQNFKNQGDNIFTSYNPVTRVGFPSEIAELAIFLASDNANYIVGQSICCDGGYSLK